MKLYDDFYKTCTSKKDFEGNRKKCMDNLQKNMILKNACDNESQQKIMEQIQVMKNEASSCFDEIEQISELEAENMSLKIKNTGDVEIIKELRERIEKLKELSDKRKSKLDECVETRDQLVLWQIHAKKRDKNAEKCWDNKIGKQFLRKNVSSEK